MNSKWTVGEVVHTIASRGTPFPFAIFEQCSCLHNSYLHLNAFETEACLQTLSVHRM